MERYYQRLIAHLRTRFFELFGVVNKDGTIIACSDEARIGKLQDQFYGLNQGRTQADRKCPEMAENGACQFSARVRVMIREGNDGVNSEHRSPSHVKELMEEKSDSANNKDWIYDLQSLIQSVV